MKSRQNYYFLTNKKKGHKRFVEIFKTIEKGRLLYKNVSVTYVKNLDIQFVYQWFICYTKKELKAVMNERNKISWTGFSDGIISQSQLTMKAMITPSSLRGTEQINCKSFWNWPIQNYPSHLQETTINDQIKTSLFIFFGLSFFFLYCTFFLFLFCIFFYNFYLFTCFRFLVSHFVHFSFVLLGFYLYSHLLIPLFIFFFLHFDFLSFSYFFLVSCILSQFLCHKLFYAKMSFIWKCLIVIVWFVFSFKGITTFDYSFNANNLSYLLKQTSHWHNG